jgi:uncharacterized membrane protein YwaF
MVSYQFFTKTAVTTVVTHLNALWPLLGGWIASRMEMIIFIYAFAWIFVLSSVIPSFILGKERSVLVQFLVCLTLAFSAIFIQDLLGTYGYDPVDQLSSMAIMLYNPILAVVYLSIPYVLMLSLDVQARRKRRKQEKMEEIVGTYIESTVRQG